MQQKTGVQTLSTVQVAIGAASARSGAVGSGMGAKVMVRLFATVDCHVKAGDATVTATTADEPLAARVEYFRLVGAEDRIAVIRSTVDGTLHVSLVTSGSDRT